ncbi:MAG: Short-chain dehydrogenase/reductase SDR [Nitrospira sp.]|nr:MAG: Short-chain dehydrogenase/reductase SDR [Nitrospira sp.]
MTMTAPLQNTVALVTGGAQGLGEALCRTLGQDGATVAIADIRGEQAEALASKLNADGLHTVAVPMDVTDADAAQSAVRRFSEQYGKLDILINNAAIDKTVPVEELTVSEWDRIMATNLRGPFVMSKLALAMMIPRRTGHIINIVSTAAKRAWANASAYHASKWGLLGLSHALHVEARSHGVKVTAVISGGMRTPFLLDRFPDIDLATLQDPQNVAETVRYLLRLPADTVVPEMTVIPMRETSWP